MEANLLPVTKLIALGLFAKCLGQVDLPPAPRNTACLIPSAPSALRSPPASLVAGIPRFFGKVNGSLCFGYFESGVYLLKKQVYTS